MAARLLLVALLVAAVAAAACLAVPASAGVPDMGGLDALAAGKKQCSGAVGECGVDEAEELGLSGGGASEALRRTLAQRQPTNRYISYAALRADQVPCNQRGRSYYSNCGSQKAANPYRRGCSVITRCARNTN
ncbi:protein RALF-like 33 [Panicum miliaceum]|uniref:Protein RALF-like 33 n=1 Tax=Panicum miliaceum TaxID=4540 RepID=A0A3L6SRT6_PANMI|nr:protein RALF-like 33 [Panicum miliaceum]